MHLHDAPIQSLDALAPLEKWFADNGWNAFAFQREVWAAYLRGESGLVHSATGSGKTLAAWLGPLAEFMESDPNSSVTRSNEPQRSTKLGSDSSLRVAPALRVLWITPMRALAADTRLSLERAVTGLELPWTVGL